jgi:7-cyano-7-deazaguanine synthase
MKAVAILSGGMDSATALAMANEEGYEIDHVIWFDYGQRHHVEMYAMQKVVQWFGLGEQQIHTIEIPRIFKPNQLTTWELTPRKDTPMREITKGVAPTFVPGRNMVMLSLAASFAVGVGATAVVGGWHWDDSSGYPDCRASFLSMMQASINEAMGTTDFVIKAPLISLSKQQIVLNAVRLAVPLEKTWSCYSPQGDPITMYYGPSAGGEPLKSCGHCDTCLLRIKGFKDAGFIDPIEYAIPIDWTGCDPITEPLL